jgi:hypothetical protein
MKVMRILLFIFFCFSTLSLLVAPVWAQGQSLEDSCFNYDSEYAKACTPEAAKKECDAKTSTDGSVYIRAFGDNKAGSCVTFLGFTQSIIKYVMLAASIIVGFMLLTGGFKYLTSRGNVAALTDARDQILHATIGVVLLATAYLIILVLQGSFGYLQLDLIGPFGAVFGK